MIILTTLQIIIFLLNILVFIYFYKTAGNPEFKIDFIILFIFTSIAMHGSLYVIHYLKII